jgi:hypothetical protein
MFRPFVHLCPCSYYFANSANSTTYNVPSKFSTIADFFGYTAITNPTVSNIFSRLDAAC